MAKCKKRILSVLISSMILTLTQQVAAETLRDAVARAISTNPDELILAAERNASKATVMQARSGYWPSLDMSAGYGRDQGKSSITDFGTHTYWARKFDINARENIFAGFGTIGEVSRTKAKTVGDSYRVWGSAEDVALATAQAYLDVLRNRELVTVARQNLSVHQSTLGMVTHLSQQGVGREADDEQTRGRLDQAQANLAAAENNLDNAETAYFKVTGMRAGSLSTPPNVNSVLLPRSEHQAIEDALYNHPIMKAADADIAQAKGEYLTAKSAFYPRVDFVLDNSRDKNVYGVEGPSDDRYAFLQLQWNLLQGGRDLGRVREVSYHIQQALEQRNRTIRQVTEQMKLSWDAYQSSTVRIPELLAHRNSQVKTVGSYRKQFGLSKRTLLDVLDAQDELYTSQQDYINERYSLLLAKYRMLNAEGKLVEYFNLPLPAEARIPYQQKGWKRYL